jgi:hypothetical protein
MPDDVITKVELRQMLGKVKMKKDDRKCSKPLPNPTRNHITRYFCPESRLTPKPRPTILPSRNAQRPINPYRPHHPTANPYPSARHPITPAPAPAVIPTQYTTFTTLSSPSLPRPINPYAPYHVIRNPTRSTPPNQPNPVPVTNPSTSPPTPLQIPRIQPIQIRNPYDRKT